MSLLTRISLIPFYLGGSDEEANQQALEDQGFEESPLTGYEKRLVGLKVTRWKLQEEHWDKLKKKLWDETAKVLTVRRKEEFQEEAAKKLSEWKDKELQQEVEKFKREAEGFISECFGEHYSRSFKALEEEHIARKKDELQKDATEKFSEWQKKKLQQEVEKQLCDRLEALTLYMERRGFGVFADREPAPEGFELWNHASVVNLLDARRELHNNVKDGSHPFAELIERLRQDSQNRSNNKKVRSLGWEEVPYVFTFYVDENVGQHRETQTQWFRGGSFTLYVGEDVTPQETMSDAPLTRQGVLVLSNPSLVGLGGSDNVQMDSDLVEEFTQRIAKLDIPKEFPDIDPNPGVFCIATWAGLVVLGRSLTGEPGSTLDLYELLEVRIQIPWIAAYLVRRWCEDSYHREKPLSAAELDEVRWQVAPLLRESFPAQQRDLSSRDTEISEGLKRTSKFDLEMSDAGNVLQELLEAAEWTENKQTQGYGWGIQWLLAILAGLQIFSWFDGDPPISLPGWADALILVGVIAGTVALIVLVGRLFSTRVWLRAQRRP